MSFPDERLCECAVQLINLKDGAYSYLVCGYANAMTRYITNDGAVRSNSSFAVLFY